MAEVIGAELNDFSAMYWRHRGPYDSHELDLDAYWRLVAQELGLAISQEQIEQLVHLDNLSWSKPNEIMTDWVVKIKGQGCSTAILSNMPLAIRQYLQKHCSWLPAFDHSTYSCDIGCIKPDSQIYEHALAGLGLEPEQVLFLDDRQENIEAARSLGMHSILFVDAKKTAPEIEAAFSLPLIF
ncbi:MAG: HAD family phosphatase [Candidatus Obscuribacterales bacterium]|nr:HAD family phosphatase [Candidatus Obscuribacterales bacterium]